MRPLADLRRQALEALASRPRLHAVLANSGWLLLDRLMRLLLGLFVGSRVARFLGPSQYGELAYALAFVAFFAAIANLGADGIVVRDLALDSAAAPKILGTTFAMRLTAGLACWLAAVLTVAATGDRTSVALVALAGASVVFQAADTIDLWFQSQSQNQRTVIAKLIAYFISNGAKLILVFTRASLLWFAAVMAFDTVAAAAGLAIAYRGFPVEGNWRRMAGVGRQILKESWPFMLSGLSIMVYTRIDQVIIRQVLGAKELGVYAAAVPLSTLWQFIPMTLYVSLAPFVARKRAESRPAYLRALVWIFRFFLWLGLAVSALTSLVSGAAVHVLYGQPFAESARVLSVHAFTNVFLFLGVANSLWIVNESKPSVSLYGTLAAGSFVLAADLYFTPRYGVMAAAYVAVAAQFIAAVLVNFLVARESFELQLEAAFGIRARRPVSYEAR